MHDLEIIENIRKADAYLIDYILDAAMKRKRELYPDWEIFYCAAEKGKIDSVEDLLRTAWEFEMMIRENMADKGRVPAICEMTEKWQKSL